MVQVRTTRNGESPPSNQRASNLIANYATDDESRIYIESSDDDFDDESIWNAGRTKNSEPPVGLEQPTLPETVKQDSLRLWQCGVVFATLVMLGAGVGVPMFLNQEETSVEAHKEGHIPASETITEKGNPTMSPVQLVVGSAWPSFAPTVAASMSPTNEIYSRANLVIREVFEESSENFDDSSSPEGMALELVRYSYLPSDTSANQILQMYTVALLAFSLGKQDNLASSVSECLWNGVTCATTLDEKNAVFRRVTGIEWPSQNLGGEVPSAIGLLQSLEVLDLSENNINGTLPESLFDIASLQQINFQNNSLNGEIPLVENLQSLKVLSLGGNQFKGHVVNHLRNIGSIESLSLVSNKFEETLPDSVNWPLLEHLDLGNNSFAGTIPESWVNGDLALVSLKTLRLDHNQLRGEVPNKWKQMESIEEIILNDNLLTGEFPGKFVSEVLTTIKVQNNTFYKVSKELCKVSVQQGGKLSTLQTDCGTCSCQTLCEEPNCEP